VSERDDKLDAFKAEIAEEFDAPHKCVPRISGGLLVNRAGAVDGLTVSVEISGPPKLDNVRAPTSESFD